MTQSNHRGHPSDRNGTLTGASRRTRRRSLRKKGDEGGSSPRLLFELRSQTTVGVQRMSPTANLLKKEVRPVTVVASVPGLDRDLPLLLLCHFTVISMSIRINMYWFEYEATPSSA